MTGHKRSEASEQRPNCVNSIEQKKEALCKGAGNSPQLQISYMGFFFFPFGCIEQNQLSHQLILQRLGPLLWPVFFSFFLLPSAKGAPFIL